MSDDEKEPKVGADVLNLFFIEDKAGDVDYGIETFYNVADYTLDADNGLIMFHADVFKKEPPSKASGVPAINPESVVRGFFTMSSFAWYKTQMIGRYEYTDDGDVEKHRKPYPADTKYTPASTNDFKIARKTTT